MVSQKPLTISVITPSFNSGDCIERAIKSVLEQDYPHWEHIIADGGSTDGTIDILKKYNHLKWKSEPDKGQTDAMNKGFARSTGDIIVYLNADDYFFPGAFTSVIEKFKEGAVFVVGNVLVKSPRLDSEFLNIPRITLRGMLRHWEPNAFCHNPVGYFYRREVQNSCRLNEDNYATQDLEFLLDAASLYPFTKIEKTLGCFEDRKETKTGKTQARLDYWQAKTFPYLDKHIAKLPLEEREVYLDDRCRGYSLMQSHMNHLNNGRCAIHTATDLPKVSVIIPAYNCENEITQALDSVLRQQLASLEILVINDASTDNTVSVLESYSKKDSRIRIISHEKNKKLGASRNTGLEHATGKYVFFLDADDWLDDGTLHKIVSLAEEYSADVLEIGVRKVWENGKTEPYHANAFACSGKEEALRYLSMYSIGSIAWNKLYLRSLLKEHNLRFVVPYWHEDVLFSTKVAYNSRTYIAIDDVFYNYYQKGDSIVNGAPTPLHLESYFKIYSDMIAFGKEKNLMSTEYEYLYRKLLRAHGSNDLYPKLVRYATTRSSGSWEDECVAASKAIFGDFGYILSDIITYAVGDRHPLPFLPSKSVIKYRIKKMLPDRVWSLLKKGKAFIKL